MKKTIDNVTVTNLDLALRMCGYQLSTEMIDNIIDLVGLLEEKGNFATIQDVFKLKETWKK